jgi:hypothetical protein
LLEYLHLIKVVNILVEDIDSGEYIVNTDDNPEDEIDAEAIVAQLQQLAQACHYKWLWQNLGDLYIQEADF